MGWGGPYSITFSLTPQRDLTLFQEQMNDAIAQGAGEDLKDLTPSELRVAINRYLDKRPDFLKFGGTSHFSQPTFIGFSPEAQRAYEASLRDVNAYIADTEQAAKNDPSDASAQALLQNAYEQKEMVYQMATARSLP